MTQRRDLAKLIDGDFDALKGELNVFVNQLLLQREQQIEEAFQERERQAREIEAEWHQFAAGLRRQADDWIAQRRGEGFVIHGRSGRYGDSQQPITVNSIEVSIPEKAREMANAKNIVNHQKMTAVQALERQRLQLQRDLLMDGLVDERARQLLDKLPNPRELLANIMAGAQEAGLLPGVRVPGLQQIEGAVEVRHEHDEPRLVMGDVID